MSSQKTIDLLSNANWYDLNMALSIHTPPWPGEKALEIHYFKRLTGAFGGGQGANGQLIEWSNNTGTHLVGERAFHSGATAIADMPLTDLCGEAVIVDLSDEVSHYSLYTPEMITNKVEVKKGDILIINTGYHKHGWDQPDVPNPEMQAGIENKEFAFLVRHPGPSPDFFQWALDMELKLVGVDCGSAEHPMNTNLRYMHGREFAKAEAKLQETHGKSWDEMYDPEAYYEMTHITLPKAGLRFLESIGGQIDELKNKRVWLMNGPIPYMEVESAWTRVVALTAPEGMSDSDFFAAMGEVDMLDMTLPFSVQTPQWANYEPLSVKYTKRVQGQYFGMGRNNAHCRASFHLASHMDGQIHFHAAGRAIGLVPNDFWFGPGSSSISVIRSATLPSIRRLCLKALSISKKGTFSLLRPVGTITAGTAPIATSSAT